MTQKIKHYICEKDGRIKWQFRLILSAAILSIMLAESRFLYYHSPKDTTRHLYVLRFDVRSLGKNRRFIFEALKAENIGVNVHYLPVYRLPYYAQLGYDPACCPEANLYYDEAITLPLHCCLSDEDAQHVVDAVVKVIDFCREHGE